MDDRRPAIQLTETKDDPEFVAFYGVADKANELLHETLIEIMPLGKDGRTNLYVHRWTLYLGTLLNELAHASADLLLLDMPRAAIVTIRSVFEYSVRTQYLYENEDEAEALMDSVQWRVWKEAKLTPGYFGAELSEKLKTNYEEWAAEHPELETGTQEAGFTDWGRDILGERFQTEWFRAYSYPSIIAHGKPHGVQDVLSPMNVEPTFVSSKSVTIDVLSELSKLAATVLEYLFFIRQKYGLDVSKVIEVNELHGQVMTEFEYSPKTPD